MLAFRYIDGVDFGDGEIRRLSDLIAGFGVK
jgi:hypothetical protein